MRRRLHVFVVILSLAACSDTSKRQQDQRAEGSNGAGADDGGGGVDLDSGLSSDAFDGYLWWRLDADLMLADGDVEAGESELRAALLDASGAEACSAVATPSEVSSVPTLPNEALVTWWSLSDLVWADDCAIDAGLPLSLSLGVGGLHPEIVAVLDGMPEASGDAGATLNGAYAQLPGGDSIYVFGAAGLGPAWSGEGEVAATAPLSDGTWELRGAYGFPL